MIRVVIVDDHEVVLAGLQQLVDGFDDVEIVGAASDGARAVDECTRATPDVALIDLEMPEMDGIEATRRIKDASPRTNVVVFTYFSDRERIMKAIDAGATGYLLKDADPRELHSAIRAAAEGGVPLHPTAAAAMLEERAGASAKTRTELSPREREVLILVGSGLANKQIARRLGISEKTVKTHLTKVFGVIGVTDRTQAALWAERNGLLSP